MKKLILPLGIVAMMLLLAGAYTFDSVRVATDARHRVTLADDEVRKHEERMVKLIAETPDLPPSMKATLDGHRNAAEMMSRQQAFDEVVAVFRRDMEPKIDPTDPLKRKFMDNIAGAINRREVAQKQFATEEAYYKEFLQGVRGKLARMFSTDVHKDADRYGKL